MFLSLQDSVNTQWKIWIIRLNIVYLLSVLIIFDNTETHCISTNLKIFLHVKEKYRGTVHRLREKKNTYSEKCHSQTNVMLQNTSKHAHTYVYNTFCHFIAIHSHTLTHTHTQAHTRVHTQHVSSWVYVCESVWLGFYLCRWSGWAVFVAFRGNYPASLPLPQ